MVFTCLSHNVIAHEMTHAVLDGMGLPHFTDPSNPDVLAFHEGFADLVALLQQFAYPDCRTLGTRRLETASGSSSWPLQQAAAGEPKPLIRRTVVIAALPGVAKVPLAPANIQIIP